MLRSMTGFGSASSRKDGLALLVEVRTVNNKFFKPTIRLPDTMQGLEAELDSFLSHHFTRGSVTASVKYADNSSSAAASLNTEAIKRYIEQIREIDDNLTIDAGKLLSLPGVLIHDTGEEFTKCVRPIIKKLLDEACETAIEMRNREGKSLEEDLELHLEKIDNHLEIIKERAPSIVSDYEQRLHQRMESLLADIGKEVTDSDLLREVAVFAERTDISEEISRLGGHLEQFRELVGSENYDPIGRTLDFLAQEMLRESNTIASKCLDGETSRRIVEIKGSIDRIKEQVQNAE
ncbi:MAG: YicC/YloC family endoribonuclease [Phycisphaerales bacterium]|nr:YicC/YloC family endoribonuclease [Phycisphaerales bacterium]